MIRLFAIFLIGIFSYGSASAKVDMKNYGNYYFVLNGQKIEQSTSARYLESTLGVPVNEYGSTKEWRLNNGATFSATFGEFGISEGSIFADKKLSNTYVVAYGKNFYIKDKTINQLNNLFDNANRCFYSDTHEGLRLSEMVVDAGAEGTVYVSFSTTQSSELTLKQVNNQKVDRLSINEGTDWEPLKCINSDGTVEKY